ncbi:MAG: hypothetical protein N2039_04610 [Gemmataceae bacterium]|nr:hypothetical protein [Gemmataceae bacterium]
MGTRVRPEDEREEEVSPEEERALKSPPEDERAEEVSPEEERALELA